jgi:hypothetical protein
MIVPLQGVLIPEAFPYRVNVNPRGGRRRTSEEAGAASSPASGNDEKCLRMAFRNEKGTSVIEPQETGSS